MYNDTWFIAIWVDLIIHRIKPKGCETAILQPGSVEAKQAAFLNIPGAG